MARRTLVMSGAGVVAALVLVFALSSASNLFPMTGQGSFSATSSSPKTEASNSNTLSNFNTNASTNSSSVTVPATFAIASTQALKKFSSASDLQSYIAQSIANSQRAAASTGFLPYQQVPLPGVNAPSLPTYGGAASAKGAPMAATPAPAPQSQAQSNSVSSVGKGGSVGVGPSYSTTNNQVTNVDEPDFLKNDAKYAYILTGDKLTIINAYPAENASITIKVGLDIPQGQTLQNMFLRGDRLAIFYQDYSQDYVIPQYGYLPEPVSTPRTHIVIMDISDRSNPKLLHDYKISGSYNDARMVGDYAYLVTTSNIDDYYHPILPRIMEGSKVVATPDVYYFDNPEQSFSFTTVTSVNIIGDGPNSTYSKSFLMDPASTIYSSENNLYITYQKYMPYNYYESNSKDRFFKAIVPLLPAGLQEKITSVESDSALSPSEKWDKISTLLQDYYNTLSESDKTQLYDKIQQSLADYDSQLQQDLQRTVIHKISLGANGTLQYVARGEVSGRLLNQFSMDENGTTFRVATTSEYYSQYRTYQYNNVFVLDSSMNTIGSLEHIAPNESIYSARFIGDRLYLVTFRQVDPFFVIDLSSPTQPKVLGSLKLPTGYSNYLHPFDATHIIGIGKGTQDSGSEFGGVEPLGVRLALFDVSDVSHPVTVGTYQIGGMGTDSEALYDHKAFFFDKQTGILSIPISVSQYGLPVPLEGQAIPSEAPGSLSNGTEVGGNDTAGLSSNGPTGADGTNSSSGSSGSSSSGIVSQVMPIRPPTNFWRGFYVFEVDAQHGFTLKAKIEHSSSNDSNGFYPYYYGSVEGGRTFNIGNVLYTVSINNIMKMNSLSDPSHEINSVNFGNTGGLVKYPPPPENAGSGGVASAGNATATPFGNTTASSP